jgi:hypothetical protein
MTCSNIGTSFPTVSNNNCPDNLGCPPGHCPDFVIRRHDTKPPFKVGIEDCDGPMDFTNLVVEFSMWAKAKLKTAITTTSTSLSFADKIGFDQVMIGDILIFDRARSPEHMKVIGFDEDNFLVIVQRGVNGTAVSNWKKGTGIRVMKSFSSPAFSELVYQDVVQLDGTTQKNVLTDSFLVYDWRPSDTCLAGCYWAEFKLLSLLTEETQPEDDSDTTFTMTLTPEQYGCKLGAGVEWVRRFPVSGEGYLIKVENSPTAEI